VRQLDRVPGQVFIEKTRKSFMKNGGVCMEITVIFAYKGILETLVMGILKDSGVAT
jgi:hypothetical protein